MRSHQLVKITVLKGYHDMIALIQGVLLEKSPSTLIVDVAGVGYELAISLTTSEKMPLVGDKVKLFTLLVVREDAHLLFGFYDRDEKQLFQTLIKVNGVGPKLALAILSTLDTQTLSMCVYEEDVKTLVKVPGVGKKTAERILIEIKDKVPPPNQLPLEAVADRSLKEAGQQAIDDAEYALIALGYKPAEAKKALSMVPPGDHTSEALVRYALRSMVAR